MKTLYLDLFSGISGDMFVGAMIDLGVDPRQLEAELAKLQVGDYHIHNARGSKWGISGVKFDVHLEHDLLHLACCRRRGVDHMKTFDRPLAAAFRRK